MRGFGIVLCLMASFLFAEEGKLSQRPVIDEEAIREAAIGYVKRHYRFATADIVINPEPGEKLKRIGILTSWKNPDDFSKKIDAVADFVLSEQGRSSEYSIYWVWDDYRIKGIKSPEEIETLNVKE